jgi:SOS-response transcriptional repressor LexA
MSTLMPRQSECLDAIRSYERSYGYAPSYIEIAMMLGLKSTHQAWDLVDKLVKAGFINRRRYSARAIEPVRHELTTAERRARDARLLAALVAPTPDFSGYHCTGFRPLPSTAAIRDGGVERLHRSAADNFREARP